MKVLSLRVCVAAILAVIAAIGLGVGLTLEFGTARRMGPGYFPVVLSGILLILALSEIVMGLLKPDTSNEIAPNPSIDWRPLIAILAAVAAFAIVIPLFGLIPAFLVVVSLSALSEQGYGWKPALILSVVSGFGAWLLFSKFLGMTLPLFQLGF